MALFLPEDLAEAGDASVAVAQHAAPNALPVAVRARNVMAAYATTSQLQALVAGTQHITAITNAAGRDQASAARTALVRTRTEIARRGKEARDDANAFAKAVIVAERELIAITAPEEERLDALVTAWEAAREAEKRAKAEAEAQRVAAIRVRMSAFQHRVRRHTTAEIRAEIERIAAIAVDDSFAEFVAEAEAAKDAALIQLVEWGAEALITEKEAAAAAERRAAEEARLAAEREAIAAERRAAQEAAAKVRAEQEAAAAALREAQRKIDDENARLAAEAKRLERAEADRVAAEERRDAEARATAERAAVEANRRAAEDAEAMRKAAARAGCVYPDANDIVGAVAEAFGIEAGEARRVIAEIDWEAEYQAHSGTGDATTFVSAA